ncbi:sulfatase [Fulvivirgaceae bacterium BMA10]|uniref:Sulfatase n=1 Tax=Splendidivirga corallicola TaxID=3051826 RepID=A0ABT8KNH6_9BACT|nr:sulfatase [Fulvivirgaceae bacterium BMA10]
MKETLTISVLLLLLTSCSTKQQNFVFILVDDLGYKDLGYTGSEYYETPNIDKLSKASIQFTQAYSSGSVCSPSRAAILTGKHPIRLRITDWIPGSRPKNQKLNTPTILNELPLEETTIADVLRDEGYNTFFAGKWHLGDKGFFPERQGFEINIGGHKRGSPPGGYYSPYKNPKLEDGPEGEYLTDRLTNESINFLDTVGQNPFFLYLSYYTVHTPIQPNKEYIDKFVKKLDSLSFDGPQTKPEGSGITNLIQNNPAYASMLFALDQNIGRLIEKLKEKGLYENTTIIFTSDNGGLSTLVNTYGQIAPTSVLPLRAGKGWLYEGGIRVPLLIKPANYSGDPRINAERVIGHDFYPTILKLAGIPLKKDASIDGIDLTPILREDTGLERKELFWHYPHYHGSAWTPGAAIIQENWKLIEFYETNTIELYDLSVDVSEKNDLSAEHPEMAKRLLNKLHELQNSMNAEMPTINEELEGQLGD